MHTAPSSKDVNALWSRSETHSRWRPARTSAPIGSGSQCGVFVYMSMYVYMSMFTPTGTFLHFLFRKLFLWHTCRWSLPASCPEPGKLWSQSAAVVECQVHLLKYSNEQLTVSVLNFFSAFCKIIFKLHYILDANNLLFRLTSLVAVSCRFRSHRK